MIDALGGFAIGLAVLFATGLAGGVGAVVRAFLANWSGVLPWGVLTANTVAAVAIGLVWPLLTAGSTWFLVSVGFAGGLSTFSTVAKDCFDFYHRGRLLQMLLNAGANLGLPVIGLLAIAAIG